MRKVFIDTPINGEFHLSALDSKHIITVLRHVPGDLLIITDSLGTAFECKLTRIDKNLAYFEPLKRIDSLIRHEPVILAAGLLKKDKFEWVIQKSVELGVDEIVPVQMMNCVVKLDAERQDDKVSRWLRIARESAKQCGRLDIPKIKPVTGFSDLPAMYKDYRFIVPYEKESDNSLKNIAKEVQSGGVVICIGPEGGFDPSEIELLIKQVPRIQTVSLGKNILRAETAAIATVSIIMYERGIG